MGRCGSCGAENREGAKFCDACGGPLAESAPAREVRKTVTVLFCDVTGSTSLGESVDPEALRGVLARYFERMKAIVESHGGSVEKFIGDAVMAVFGVPVLHEDDALRAVRAAVEMRDALPELGVQARIGVNTGEVVTGTEERLATGDAVNVAARLEQAAAPGEVLLGDETFQLVRGDVEAEALEPQALKGKSERVAAHRLVRLREAGARLGEAPLVGRVGELDLLRRSYERAVSERACHLFTLLGTAGVGKSRLVEELVRDLDEARVVRGRCLSYGEGMTYFPVVGVLKQLLGPDADFAPALRGILGEDAQPTTPQEVAWAFRKLLEAVAQAQPLVVVFDDVHWGEPTFLDLIEHVADLSRDAPILLLCAARPELLERRPAWGGGKLNATTALLEPLGALEADALISALGALDADLRVRILDAAAGNPLFVEEMVAMVLEAGDGELAVPPSIHALLAARLDQLPREERRMLECGSVEGKEFHRGGVVALAPEEADPDAHLTRLVRKDLIRPERATLLGEDAYGFRHLLIRDAAYESLPKAARAQLHERFAAWLDERGAELVEHDEIAGYHLEQAYRYKAELGQLDAELGRRASSRLAAAGWRARERSDAIAEENLLERALALLPADEVDERIELELIEAYDARGRAADRDALREQAISRAVARGDRVAELSARLSGDVVRRLSSRDEGEALAREAIEVLTAAGNDASLARAWRALAWVEFDRCQAAKSLDCLGHALEHARRAGDAFLERSYVEAMLSPHGLGPTPVSEALAFLDEHEEISALSGARRGELEAMVGHFDEARRLLAEARRNMEERGLRLRLGGTALMAIDIELWAGDPDAAVREGLEGYGRLEEVGAREISSTVAALLGQAFLALERPIEAERWSRVSEEAGVRDDVVNEIVWRTVRAGALARTDRLPEAEQYAREAVSLAGRTDWLSVRASAHEALAEIMRLTGRENEARVELETAIDLYDQKGAIVLAQRARATLSEVPLR